MIKNIIFDIGNVLLTFRPQAYLESLGYTGETANQLHKAIFENHLWKELDRGTYTREEAVTQMIRENPSLEKEIATVLSDNWLTILQPVPGTGAIVQKLKAANYKLYLLSNYHKESIEAVKKRNDFFNCFDGGIISCYVHAIKPEKEIYQALLDQYALNPNESLFIDDLQENLDAAKNLGIQTILFTTADQLKKDLINRGILNH